MKKMISLAAALAVLMTAGCSDKKSTKDEFTSPPPTVTQLMYKQEDLDFPEDMGSRLGIYYSNGVKLAYEDKDRNVQIMSYDEDMKDTWTTELESDNENVNTRLIDVRPDGSIIMLTEYVEYDGDMSDIDDYYENAQVSFRLSFYASDLSLEKTVDVDELSRNFELKGDFISGLYTYGDKIIIILKEDQLLLADSDGNIIDNITSGSGHAQYGTDSEGNTIAALWDKYAYLNGDDLSFNENNAKEYGKWINRTGPVFTGAGDYKAFMVMNEGIYGLTYGDELIQLLDFTDSNISPNGIWNAAYAGEGKFVIMGDDQMSGNGMFLSLLTVRPDDYVENKKKLTVAVVEGSDNTPEIATIFNKKSDAYTAEVKTYSTDDDLKLDVLSGNSPDLVSYREADFMYRYVNLGAFADLYDLMDEYGGMQADDIVDNVRTAYEYKGGLYGLPIVFHPVLFMANSEVIGREYTYWGYEDLFSFGENMPEGMHLGSKNSFCIRRDLLFSELCYSGASSFIDYDNYTCNFDSEEFIHLLNFCNEAEINEAYDWGGILSNENEQQMIEYNEAEMSVLNKTSLLYQCRGMSMARDFLGLPCQTGLYLNDNYTYLIPPSDDGKGAIMPGNAMTFSVMEQAPDKEGAWEFYKYIMSEKFHDNYLQTMDHFSSNKKCYEKQMNDLRSDSENFLFIKGENWYVDTGTGSYSGKEETYKKPLTDEDLEYFKDIINNSTHIATVNSEVYSILQEECGEFIAGEISAEDCAAMIQNRVQLYLSEQSG